MIIITAPTIEPVHIAEVKAQLGITSTDTVTDLIIARRITEARTWAENYTQRAFITQTREIRFDSFQVEFELPSATAIVTLKYIATDGTLTTVSSADYALDTYSDIPFVRLVWGSSWPSARSERNAVRIQFTAGYGAAAAVDPLIKEAIMLLVGHWMNFQKQSESGLTLSHIPRAIERILDPFTINRYL